jgi:hypothetical protein
MTSIGDAHHYPRIATKATLGGPDNEWRGCRALNKPCRRNHAGETPPHLPRKATFQGLQGDAFKKHTTCEALPPPNPKILGFHPKHKEDNEQPHDASTRGMASIDVTIIAQTGKGFPSAKLNAYYTGYESLLEQHLDHRSHTRLASTMSSSRPWPPASTRAFGSPTNQQSSRLPGVLRSSRRTSTTPRPVYDASCSRCGTPPMGMPSSN